MNTRILAVEIVDELRGIIREPAALLFSIVMPVAFFALFASLFGGAQGGAVPTGTIMLATFGTFGVLSVVLTNPGIGVASDRERGWLRAKRVSPVPLGVTLTAKVVAALPYAIGVLAAMTVTSALLGTLQISPGALIRLWAALVLGALPFALFGLAVGFQVGANATTAILNALLFPMAIASGLWMPLSALPDFFGQIAPFLPTYHLAQLALAQLDGSAALGHALVLLGATAVTGTLAAVSYRHARS
ncbi:ABC-2 type transport system permease protein [Saccharopolyspora antimicrobica]|uniref:ABC-2 type transport system permease protein n=1 Tax=Saccharopolyspora antimicrobica TaxID=455193 RepID=A0A1I5EJ09_9PSEU|nr:ABC transporter permease [Saccharopolyspora antimicrobica]RKT86839.1 ABC-2 type transport system permease protein [Saccharopolyspora antimicrobica]SFO11509.1 ABC-2 type transport system permease protein [Saccharopolyspora antimicrobica]